MYHKSVSTIGRLFALLTSALLLASVTSCNHRTMTPAEASQWISAYTPAHIDCDARIRIELTDLAQSKIDSTRRPDDVFILSPSVKGTARFSDDMRYLDFIPSESMKQGQEYSCGINLRELTGVDTLGRFNFKFHVDRREMRFDGVKAVVDPDDISMMTVTGRVEYSTAAGDSITADSTVIACSYPGAKVVMDKKAMNMGRGFKVTGIKRRGEDFAVTLSLNPMGGFSHAEQSVDIPSVEGFRLLDARRVEAAEPYIDMEFSAPLSATQELDGLISIDDVPELRIERYGTNVKLFYPANGISDLTLRISDLLRNNDGISLDEEIERHFRQEVIPPAVEIPFEGTILPDNRNLKLAFRAVNLAAVDVEVVKIYPSNVMAFLQTNDMDECSGLRRFGRLIYRRTVRLDGDKSVNLHRWQDFSIDLKGLFAKERGSIYNIRLTFRKEYSLYDRSKPADIQQHGGVTANDEATWDESYPYIYRENPDYNWSECNWNETGDPSKASYYMCADMPEVNLVASDLGLIVKRSDDHSVSAAVTDIITARPAAGVTVTAFNYQMQETGRGVTDENGFTSFTTKNTPFIVTATDGRSTTYLKTGAGHEISTSNFEVSGKKMTDGIKEFIYGERGVWRPGDDIHLTLILDDRKRKLPANHPVVMELYNPSEQLYARQTLTTGTDGFYVFHIPTEESVPTGLWEARFKVGNEVFKHPVRIETIKPNRLKIAIQAPDVMEANVKTPVGIDAHWLAGPAAKGLQASAELALYTDPAPFEKFRNFIFSNPLVDFETSEKALFKGVLDSIGHISRECTVGTDINAPGMLRANITAKVAEPGGDASIVSRQVRFSPFGVYVGINLGNRTFLTDTTVTLPVVAVNRDGVRMKTRDLDYKIYRLRRDSWWEGQSGMLGRYVQSSSAEIVSSGSVTAVDGLARVPFRVDGDDWGSFLVMVRDRRGGHATGGVVTAEPADWYGRAGKDNTVAGSQLSFTLDKRQYEAGETASVYFPKCDGGRVLLSIENGSGIIRRQWVQLSATGDTQYQLKVDRSMAPNFYVTATLLRPHRATDMETPIRLFGVQGAEVIDRSSILHPVIDMAEELHPGKPFTIKVSEKDGKPMTYTLAVVDEGLLDITGFRTPRPWQAMNMKEALGVRTWDMFDDVIGAFGAGFRQVLSIGGDEALRKAAGKEKRFNPAVKFIGPFTLGSGSKSHTLTLSNYVGSVRVMVVAAHNGSYGSADRTVKVTSPLMLLSTLPRELACGDTVAMPVNVFAMERGIGNVALEIETEGPLKATGSRSRSVAFSAPGEQTVDFHLACDGSATGKARVVVTASGNGHIYRDTTYIDVSNPMPLVTETVDRTLGSNSAVELAMTPRAGANTTLQLSSMPTLNFGGAYLFFDSYPHLCTEQLSSKALFMLFGRSYINADNRKRCEKALPAVIRQIRSRQTTGGAFTYWPGQSQEYDWVTTMAGLVMTEAGRQGFSIDSNCFELWKKYQETAARNYRHSADTDLEQAFRLYSLAAAGAPPAAAMNRLRESKSLSRNAAYCLASAYMESGRRDVALKLIERAERTTPSAATGTFGTPVRDLAIEMYAYAMAGDTDKALPLARKIASACSGADYVTQDLAFATMAMNRLHELTGDSAVSAVVTEQGKTPVSVAGVKGMTELALDPCAGKVKVENRGNASLEMSLLSSYRPAAGDVVTPVSDRLRMDVSYTDMNGKRIAVDNLRQNTEFKARITVTNLSNEDVDNMALTYAVPSGWEIWNDRMHSEAADNSGYRDIRDCSYNVYFPLKKGATASFEIRLCAAYKGRYMLPPTVCVDMYNPSCRAMTSNRRVTVD